MLAAKGGVRIAAPEENRWPVSGEIDREALMAALKDLQKGGHPIRERFEARFAADCGVKYAFAVSNGTVSLELILRALGIGHGDEVILPPYTFIATVSSILYAGARPVFADIDRGSYNISAAGVRAKLTARTKAVVAVAVGGRSPDLDALGDVARAAGVALIVDGAQGVGAEWRGRSIFAWGDAASLSCQNSKNLTCGEGGMITTNRDDVAAKLRAMLYGAPEAQEIAQDAGLPELQAALLESQYVKLPAEMKRRTENAAYLAQLLRPLDIVGTLDDDPRLTVQAHHLMVLRLNVAWMKEKGVTRAQIIKALTAEGLPLFGGYEPLYTFPCLKDSTIVPIIGEGIDLSPLPECEIASYEEGLWLLQNRLLGTKKDMETIAAIFRKLQDEIDAVRTL